MDSLLHIVGVLNNVPPQTWAAVVEITVSAFIVSPVALALKKWLDIHGEKLMVVLVITGSMLASAVAYLQTVPDFGPWFIAVQGWLVFATTQPVYHFLVKPLSARVGAWFASQVEKANQFNLDIKTAAVPAGGLPVTGTRTEVQDFSQ